MRLPLPLVLTLLVHQWAIASPPTRRSYSTHDYYVLEHNPLAGATLAECAQELGLEVVEQAGELANTWLARTAKLMSGISTRTASDGVMDKFETLRLRSISHQGSDISSRTDEQLEARRIASSIKHLSLQTPRQRSKRDGSHLERAPPPPATTDPTKTSEAIAARLGFVDPLFTKQWHIVNNDNPRHMMNVTGVWEMGITGTGVITSLVDDGLDYRSKDLADNFDAVDSYDFNDHTDLPTPKLSDDHHGTRCAGQIGAAKNDVCGVGLAYDSKVAGVRILSGPITDVDEAAALNYGFQNVSIYSCSWGPPDDGKSMEGPGYLIQKAVLNGVENGRAGKGSIFVFASGNGAGSGDQCNFDGYTNSIYSVTVSAVDYKGLHPYYSEPCAANLVVAYSSGSGKQIVTTDVGENACSSGHGGTSAAAPNAAGVFALALQARPDLTWRDIQHLCVKTAQMINPEDPDWETMASGQRYSYKYGFGSLDGYAYVTAAQNWQLVKPQAWFEPAAVQINNGTMDDKDYMSGGQPIVRGGVTSTFTVTKDMLATHNFEGLEHVTIRVWITHTKRGDVEVELVSPSGVKSVLAAKRDRDRATSGYPGWRFMSVKHWGENPIGEWKIRVSDQSEEGHSGNFLGWRLMFWGSTIDPSLAKNYLLPTKDRLLPSVEETDTIDIPIPSSTKSHPKPTAGLPADHGEAGGESSKPAFPPGQDDTKGSPSATMTPTPDEGWFSDMSNLVSNQKWFFAAVGAVVLFGIGAGVFFWRRRVARRKSRYSSLADDDMAMNSVSRGARRPRAKELYDAFGEVSDDEDADEETGLRPGGHLGSAGLGFHSGFLDDDDPPTAGPTPIYRDEPEENEEGEEGAADHHDVSPEARSLSPGSGSGDGSWEHASQTR
ncbi:hypothetical protein BV22DRAFT_1036240 [Leucogyrophana mollusca]|uniref:Uncharacterized protein n=1 Tax=Leucogyrophana mollusca TaxID=85980 RepID=A0ACB8BDP2_9AGAM|nr:hypothetical protein BV22DRAFT_1036240 [Leucogyrophana mollusca]